jgi:hypothetical protein
VLAGSIRVRRGASVRRSPGPRYPPAGDSRIGKDNPQDGLDAPCCWMSRLTLLPLLPRRSASFRFDVPATKATTSYSAPAAERPIQLRLFDSLHDSLLPWPRSVTLALTAKPHPSQPWRSPQARKPSLACPLPSGWLSSREGLSVERWRPVLGRDRRWGRGQASSHGTAETRRCRACRACHLFAGSRPVGSYILTGEGWKALRPWRGPITWEQFPSAQEALAS